MTITDEKRSGTATNGRFGEFGGTYVSELLVPVLKELENEFEKVETDLKEEVENE